MLPGSIERKYVKQSMVTQLGEHLYDEFGKNK